MKLVLVGYMGSGKTYISKLLSEKREILRVDLDQYIERKEGLTVSEIFSIKGVVVFRQLERKYLLELLEKPENMILSVGGGTPCFGDNMEVMNKLSCTVYLKTPLDTLYNRLKYEKEKRPLIARVDDGNLKEFIAKHLFERQPFYERSSYTIDTSKDISVVVENILKLC